MTRGRIERRGSRDTVPERIARAREPQKLPVVPCADEVVRFPEVVASLKSRAALTCAYAAGMRVSEAVARGLIDRKAQGSPLRSRTNIAPRSPLSRGAGQRLPFMASCAGGSLIWANGFSIDSASRFRSKPYAGSFAPWAIASFPPARVIRPNPGKRSRLKKLPRPPVSTSAWIRSRTKKASIPARWKSGFKTKRVSGKKNKITRRWAKRGTKPSAPNGQRAASAFISGAIRPVDGKVAALVFPRCDGAAMYQRLREISREVDRHKHVVLIVNQAGRHISSKLKAPANITIISLPPKRPELGPAENLWQFMRDGWLLILAPRL